MDERDDPMPHEASGVNLRALAVAAGIVGSGIAIALVAPWAVIARSTSPFNAPNNAQRPAIAGPVQPTAPALELQAYREAKRLPVSGNTP